MRKPSGGSAPNAFGGDAINAASPPSFSIEVAAATTARSSEKFLGEAAEPAKLAFRLQSQDRQPEIIGARESFRSRFMKDIAPAISPPTGIGDAKPANQPVLDWVGEVELLVKPENIFWCDGSERENNFLLGQAERQNALIKLNDKKVPRS